MTMYVIASKYPSDNGEPLFWNNDSGWQSLNQATVFSEEEKRAFYAPFEAYGWLILPKQ